MLEWSAAYYFRVWHSTVRKDLPEQDPEAPHVRFVGVKLTRRKEVTASSPSGQRVVKRPYSVFNGLGSGPFDAYSNAVSRVVHDFLCQAEVGHFGHVVFGYEHVAGGQIAMDDALLLQVAHAVANVSVERKRLKWSESLTMHNGVVERRGLHDKLEELEFG